MAVPARQEGLVAPEDLPTPIRSYKLALTRAEAMKLVSASMSGERDASGLLVVEESGQFALYKPWEPSSKLGEARWERGLNIGPAVRGTISFSVDGSVLRLRVKPMAVPPHQRAVVFTTWSVLILSGVLLIVAGGGSWFSLGFVATLAGCLALGLVRHRASERERDIRDLLSRIEGIFAPHELPREDPGPLRRVLPPHRLAQEP